MKKIEIFIGSPRKRGNTNILAEMLVEKIDKGKAVAETSYLYDYQIKPCTDCRACKKELKICIINDDMKKLYAKFDEADILIIGTPIYWFGPSAQAKLMVDRFRPYYVNKKLAGKKAALLLPAGTGEQDCDLTIEMFKRSFEALGIDYLGAVPAKGYDIGDVNDDPGAIEAINKLSAQINNIL